MELWRCGFECFQCSYSCVCVLAFQCFSGNPDAAVFSSFRQQAHPTCYRCRREATSQMHQKMSVILFSDNLFTPKAQAQWKTLREHPTLAPLIYKLHRLGWGGDWSLSLHVYVYMSLFLSIYSVCLCVCVCEYHSKALGTLHPDTRARGPSRLLGWVGTSEHRRPA